MELLSTGIPALDRALGGGLLEDSNLLIVYDTYSKGWALAFEILRNRIRAGDFGVIIDSVLPISSLEMELRAADFDIASEGMAGNVAVIDVFSSFYGIEYPYDFVYTDGTMDAGTFLPKYSRLYRRLLTERIGDRRPVGIDVTIDGLAFLFGTENFLSVFQRLIADKEKARITETRKRPINIFLLNRGRASGDIVAWVSLYSQYVLEFSSSSAPLKERMIIRKSPLPEFNPLKSQYSFRLWGGKVELSPVQSR
ncbi:hypothetical protein [Thermococcus sp. JdF3]|uniref:hypothetical protein n=1 Tax=Thermococcus sp. JdF3 TaxID=1638258 RepID=UPI0014399B10|nr:hypothetical protein [Thermococcus sp. JdF3]NJE02062.1 hypothetical protein [Thermococcus sp. JdF3]